MEMPGYFTPKGGLMKYKKNLLNNHNNTPIN